jgi:hypothetical protein
MAKRPTLVWPSGSDKEGGWLAEQLRLDVAGWDDAIGPIESVVDFSVMRNPQAGEECGDHIAGDQRIGVGVGSDSVTTTVDQPLLKASTDHHQAVAEVPVISSGIGVDLGSAAEVAEDANDGALE